MQSSIEKEGQRRLQCPVLLTTSQLFKRKLAARVCMWIYKLGGKPGIETLGGLG